MRGSVRRRLLVGVGLGVASAFVIAGVIVFVLVKRSLVEQFDDGLRTKAKAMSLLVEREGDAVEVEDISPNVPGGEYFEIMYEGKLLLRSNSERSDDMRDVRIDFAPRGEAEEDMTRPTASIAYARATTELDASLARIRTILLVVGASSLLVLLGALYALTRRGLQPVELLAAQIAAIPEMLPRLSEDRPLELVIIAKRVNELLARVDQTLQRERALTAEVAHELRTPLTGLRATIEVALDREREPARYRDALAQCLAITKQTERLVEAMLSLAKLDAGVVELHREPVALDTLVREVVATHAIDTDLAAVTVDADRAMVTSILQNLVDNALAYGGSARIELTPTRLRVINRTTLEDASQVFERFWRGDTARTAGTHAGLGLTICKRLVEALGWSISAEIQDGKFIATIATSKTNVDSADRDP